DPNARKASEVIIKHANALLEAKPIAYVKTGRRMLAPAGETVSRIKYLGMAYHLTGEKKYAEGGVAVLLAATKIPHWNPSHYLDTAGLCLATGLGYDWFYDQLTPAQRETVVKAIVDKGIETSFGGRPWWANGKSNWNQVCNSGLGIAALAIWEDEPQVAAQTIKRSLKGIPHTMDTYAPDGIYFEGPSYWSYGTSYTVQFIDALENVMGTDFGLSKFPGFMESVDAIN
ncbi:MAG: heparinase, partial [Victivallales bacterium]|nr:heparinase [Victivallales bacterium]